jgi:hypothetical protein
VPYRVELAGTNGTTAIRSITIDARPGRPLDPQHLDEGSLHAIMALTLSYAAGATSPHQQPDGAGPDASEPGPTGPADTWSDDR